MIRAFTLIAALVAAAPVFADFQFPVNRYGLNGSLDIVNSTVAGSAVGVDSAVSGSLASDRPGRTSVSSWALNRTNVWSVTNVRPCGRCGGLSLSTASGGNTYSAGGANGFIGPRLDPIAADYAASGGGVALTNYERTFDLHLDGFARIKEFSLF